MANDRSSQRPALWVMAALLAPADRYRAEEGADAIGPADAPARAP